MAKQDRFVVAAGTGRRCVPCSVAMEPKIRTPVSRQDPREERGAKLAYFDDVTELDNGIRCEMLRIPTANPTGFFRRYQRPARCQRRRFPSSFSCRRGRVSGPLSSSCRAASASGRPTSLQRGCLPIMGSPPAWLIPLGCGGLCRPWRTKRNTHSPPAPGTSSRRYASCLRATKSTPRVSGRKAIVGAGRRCYPQPAWRISWTLVLQPCAASTPRIRGRGYSFGNPMSGRRLCDP